MHLVFLNQYYPPDAAPTGVMLEAVVAELCAQGHEVTVICAEGGYAGERHKTSRRKTQEEEAQAAGALASSVSQSSVSESSVSESSVFCLPVFRLLRIRASRFGWGSFLGKLADYVSYYAGVKWRLLRLRPRPDRIVALTTPPYLSVLARVFSKLRGGDHAHWVMDLYPDVMVAHGMMRDGGLAHRLLAAIARWGFGGKRCAAVLTLGPDMAERVARLMKTPQAGEGISWIPLWSGAEETGEADGMAVANRRHEMGWKDDELVVMYSGNMGLGHRFGEVLEVARQAPGGVRFAFFGGGKRRGEIEAFIAANPGAAVELHDYAPSAALAAHLRGADVHLASLAPEWSGTMVPSKLQGIFAAGRPVIFLGDARSSIGRWVTESGGGWVVPPGDPAALARAIDEARDPAARAARGTAALAFAAAKFDRTANSCEVARHLATPR